MAGTMTILNEEWWILWDMNVAIPKSPHVHITHTNQLTSIETSLMRENRMALGLI